VKKFGTGLDEIQLKMYHIQRKWTFLSSLGVAISTGANKKVSLLGTAALN
jgi:hypothetical protein